MGGAFSWEASLLVRSARGTPKRQDACKGSLCWSVSSERALLALHCRVRLAPSPRGLVLSTLQAQEGSCGLMGEREASWLNLSWHHTPGLLLGGGESVS